MINFPNFKDYCEAACRKLWGEPTSQTKKELRWNGENGYSARTYTVRKKAWYDHGQERGGSTLHLVDYVKGRPKRDLRGAVFFEVWREANAMGIVPDPAPPPKNGGGKPVLCTYSYCDEQGELLFQVVRFDTADREERFRQRRPDGKGGWIWDLKGVRRVLYRLPELKTAMKAGARIILPEGEKDVGTAVQLGYAATTMCGGVGKWRKEYTEALVGANVVIISDNDPQAKDPQTGLPAFHPDGRPKLPGQDHAASVARRLSQVAASVRVIMFPRWRGAVSLPSRWRWYRLSSLARDRRLRPSSMAPRSVFGGRSSVRCRRVGLMPPPSRSWSGRSRRRPFARVRRRSCALSAPKKIRTPTQLVLWGPSTPPPVKVFRICLES